MNHRNKDKDNEILTIMLSVNNVYKNIDKKVNKNKL